MDWRYNTIWFDQIEEDKQLILDCKEKPLKAVDFTRLEYVIIWHFKHKGLSFDLLPASNSLLHLELHSSNIENLDGIAKYKNLKRLELHYCTKLQNDTGLSSLQDTIEFLHINQSKKFTLSEELYRLINLKVLCLNSCANLENLNFLQYFPNLIDFRFVDTNIVNGDLTPILDHPSIKSVGFNNKRHYNYNNEQINSKIKTKSSIPFKDWAYKGEYKTFKYNNFNS